MEHPTSPYYPPRAPWYRSLREWGYALLSFTRLDRLRPPPGLTRGQFLGCLVIPGYAFTVGRPTSRSTIARLSPSRWLPWITPAWFAAFVVCLAGLGYRWSGVGFGLLIGVHASGILHAIRPWLASCRPVFRLAFGAAAVAGLIGLVYLPLQRQLESRAFFPLELDGRPIVVARGQSDRPIRRGDWIAYRLDAHDGGSIRTAGGQLLGRVLALPGDTVEFGPGTIRVNGQPGVAEGMLPAEGGLRLPPDCWFVWPGMRTVVQQGVTDEQVQSALLDMAQVKRDQLLGRPFRHWFLRSQALP